jgi:hypothetical protein
MAPEKINYDLIETVIAWIVAGVHDFPTEGSILVSTCSYSEKSSLSFFFSRRINCFCMVSVSILQMVLSRF